MSTFRENDQPLQQNLLIAFSDLSNFEDISSSHSSKDTFDFISCIYEITGEVVEQAGGTVIKFIGDASLCVFPEELVERGIITMLDLKHKIDDYNRKQEVESQLRVKCHYGEVTIGLIGTQNEKRFDIIGNAVNFCARLQFNGNDFAISEDAYQQLGMEARKLFVKDEPIITYVPLNY